MQNTAEKPAKFAIIGHRGAAGIAPENTLASFAEALAWQCPMIELDVHNVTGAGGHRKLAVIHDDTLDRTTNVTGRVADLRVSDLAAIDAGQGERVPLLDDVFALLRAHHAQTIAAQRQPDENEPDGKKMQAQTEKLEAGSINDPALASTDPLETQVILNIELKGQGTGRTVAETLLAVHDIPVLVSSFNHEELARFRSLDATTPVALLYHRWDAGWLDTARELDACAINLSSRIAWPKRIKSIRDAGFDVFVYTVNSVRRARQLRQRGVSGIFSDRPDKMVEVSLGM